MVGEKQSRTSQSDSHSKDKNTPVEARDSDKDTNSASHSESVPFQPPLPDDPPPPSVWQAVYDEGTGAYYYWNVQTNETSWTVPDELQQQPPLPSSPPSESNYAEGYYYDGTTSASTDAERKGAKTERGKPYHIPARTDPSLLPASARIATPSSSSVASPSPNPLHPEAPQQNYTYAAHFNAWTGKFQSVADADKYDPARLSQENRSMRQMQAFFDVNKYMEERNAERLQGKKRQRLTKEQVQQYKKRNEAKKMEKRKRWLIED